MSVEALGCNRGREHTCFDERKSRGQVSETRINGLSGTGSCLAGRMPG
jgi:hypothetical protein